MGNNCERYSNISWADCKTFSHWFSAHIYRKIQGMSENIALENRESERPLSENPDRILFWTTQSYLHDDDEVKRSIYDNAVRRVSDEYDETMDAQITAAKMFLDKIASGELPPPPKRPEITMVGSITKNIEKAAYQDNPENN